MLNYASLNTLVGTEAFIAFIATLSIISYDSSQYLASLLIIEVYKYIRIGFNYGVDIVYVRRTLFVSSALVFIYLYSRSLNKRYRESFLAIRQRGEMIALLQSVLNANHEGMIITVQDKIVYHNNPLLKILNYRGAEKTL
jgi:PAS domain-containing protein